MNTLRPTQIPTRCEVAGVRMPAIIPWVCGGSPVTHTLEGRIYHCEDKDLIPIRLYICEACALKYTRTQGKFIDVQPLTEYTFEEYTNKKR